MSSVYIFLLYQYIYIYSLELLFMEKYQVNPSERGAAKWVEIKMSTSVLIMNKQFHISRVISL